MTKKKEKLNELLGLKKDSELFFEALEIVVKENDSILIVDTEEGLYVR